MYIHGPVSESAQSPLSIAVSIREDLKPKHVIQFPRYCLFQLPRTRLSLFEMAASHVNSSFASEAHRLHYEDQVARYAKEYTLKSSYTVHLLTHPSNLVAKAHLLPPHHQSLRRLRQLTQLHLVPSYQAALGGPQQPTHQDLRPTKKHKNGYLHLPRGPAALRNGGRAHHERAIRTPRGYPQGYGDVVEDEPRLCALYAKACTFFYGGAEKSV